VIEMRDAMRALREADPDAVVLTAETSNRAFSDVSDPQDNHLPLGIMSKASSVGLGIALAQPDRNVVVFDGDGCLLMNLGTMVTVSRAAPTNLVHILLDNDVYAMTGGQPVPSAGVSDLPAMARSAGYRNVYEFDDIEQFVTDLPKILEEDGPTLVNLATVIELGNPADWVNDPTPRKRWNTAVPEVRARLTGE
jgi:thiamine pyrophosphate-dependent acetolactate synthase large subunit-like protein